MAVVMNVTVFWFVRSCRLETAAYNFTVPERRRLQAGIHLPDNTANFPQIKLFL
jgi:hypothetical protein